MATPAAFSRLQLAAALLEYDNDPDDPNAPYRSAQDSAIFAHFRRNPAARPEVGSRRSDYLGVSLPSESGSIGGRDSALDTRRSRGSKSPIDALRNPFGVDNNSEIEPNEEQIEEGLEVDLASWGLDAFMPKDKSKSAKAKAKQPAVGSTRSGFPSTSYESPAAAPRRALVTTKSMSVGGHIEFETQALSEERRRSFGSPLDLAGMEVSNAPLSRRRATSQASLTPSQSMMVPFPTASVRSPSPGIEQALGDSRSIAHNRTYSTASMNSKFIFEGADENGIRQRNTSVGTLGLSKTSDDNPFAIENPSHISRFDPKVVARARSYSNASLSSRIMLENDNISVVTGDPNTKERRYSTLELLRPKVLVMPSPLQLVSTNVAPEPVRKVRGGFELSTDGPPLPPGARTSRRLSSSMSVFEAGTENIPVASNSFTPNPLMDLTASQKLFRNTLVVGGQGEWGADMPRATQDGEQAQLGPSQKEEALPVPAIGEAHSKPSRPAGKLYGKSLIDDLENRKAQMRSKQRVFKGDERPSMMAREQQRSSTLIDPASLQARPSPQRLSSFGSQNTQLSLGQQQSLGRIGSITAKPLLTFDADEDKLPQRSSNGKRLPATHSVFGVDTLWEREMVKLKEIQAREKEENEAKRKAEEEAEQDRQEKKNKRKKGKGKADTDEHIEQVKDTHVAVEPPTLPDIQRATRPVPPKPTDSDISSESEDEDIPIRKKDQATPSWHVGSSDEEDDGPRRTTGVGPRYPNQVKMVPHHHIDEDSEEDLPLAAAIHKAVARSALTGSKFPPQSDDEDRPLSYILRQVKSSTSPIQNNLSKLSLNFDNHSDDDDQPLGLRASRIPTTNMNGDIEDDMPLAFHPEQQRRTQYQMLAQQQQHQQMMLQAQLQSNMLMNASMMGHSYYAPPVINPMAMMHMQGPMPIPSPPPIPDEAKFGSVDRWRRGVVVEGENV